MNFSAKLATDANGALANAIIDRAVILDRVGGDEELLREISAIFLQEYPPLIAEIEAAIATSDSKRLERAAHSLKGSVANFAAEAATQAAFRLESMGRRAELQEAGAALRDLLVQFRQLRPALEDLAA
jgi:HPt (histidine-containing phosphotransfer) domain-containing protein